MASPCDSIFSELSLHISNMVYMFDPADIWFSMHLASNNFKKVAQGDTPPSYMFSTEVGLMLS
jgi:hypothetical protein